MLIVSLIAVLLSAGFRLFQLFTNIEEHTGFFKTMDWAVYTMYAIVLACIVTLFSIALSSKQIPASRPVFRKSPALLVGGLLFSMGLAMDVALSLVQLIKAFQNVKISGAVLVKILFTDGMFSVIFRAICAVLACLYFLLLALSYANEKSTYCDYKLMALAPLFWTLFRMVSRFMTKISFLQVSELVFELALLAFMALFFLSFARVSSQVSQKGEMKKVVRYGLISAYLALFISISRLVCLVGGRGALCADGFAFSLADLGYGVFVFIYIFEHVRYGRPASEDDEVETEEEIQAAEEKTELDETFLED